MGIPAEKLLEVALGSPLLVGYLAYVVGLLIVIAAVKVASGSLPIQPHGGIAITTSDES